jgi:hypothetical protein
MAGGFPEVPALLAPLYSLIYHCFVLFLYVCGRRSQPTSHQLAASRQAAPAFISSISYALYHKRGLMARAFLFLNDPVQSLAHAHVGSIPSWGAIGLPIFHPSVYKPHAPYHKRS